MQARCQRNACNPAGTVKWPGSWRKTRSHSREIVRQSPCQVSTASNVGRLSKEIS